MTEALRASPYGAYHHQEDPRRSTVTDEGLSTKKTMVVLVIVVGCFAVLWPKIFYPMLVNNANSQMKPGPVDKTTGCCDVISELDVDTLKIMSELCSTIIDTTGKTPPRTSKEIVSRCRTAVLETCGIDISAALQDRVSLGHSVRQILEEVRSFNGSLCLKYNFGLSPWRLGVPHRVNINLDPANTIKQERPSHLRSDMVHPAFKERGRAIPQPDPAPVPRRPTTPPKIVEGRPGPIPGMRPAMGGPGHVVPPSKQTNYGVMGVLMPIYTVGFVVFFTYTVMKLVFKKKTEAYVGAPLYPPCEPDEKFHKDVFEASQNYFHRPNKDTSKIGWKERDARDDELDQLRKRLRETELAMERIVEQMAQAPLATQDEIKANGSLPKEDEQGTVKVMGMETTASVESGKKWSRPDSPVLPHPHPVVPKEPSPPPQQIFLEGALPPQSQILVADSATETQKDAEDDSPVVLAGKMTLSVISLDSETGTDESSNSVKKVETSDEERRTSSSNVSEEFEKVNAADLEDQIDNIIEEAGNIALTEENRFSLGEELDKFPVEIPKAPLINDKDRDIDVLEEIKNQFNLEDDLLQALKEKEPEGKVSLPVTDIIKEFLSNEENALFEEKGEIKMDHISSGDEDRFIRDKRSLSEEREKQEIVTESGLTKEDLEILERQEEMDDSIFTKEDLEMVENQQDQSTIEDVVSGIRNEQDNTFIDKNIDLLERQEQTPTKVTSAEDVDNAFVKEELDLLKKQQEYLLAKDHISKPTEEEIKGESHKEIEAIVADSNNKDNREEELGAQDEDKLSLTETITDLESSENNLGSSFSIIDEHRENSEDMQGCETTPEQTNGNNKADLLLQGLLVKEDEQFDDRKEDVAEIEESLLKSEDKDVALDEAGPNRVEEDIEEEESEELNEIEKASSRDHISREDRNFRVIDAEEALIDDEDYDDSEDDLVDDEVRDINREVYEDHRESIERRLNGDNADSSRNGAANSETAAENEISEDEDLQNEDDEEIEEIIEYVDNTDDEGEEVVEINGNDENRRN